ncbi:Rv0361 family membrane protein [Nocardia goodfellowii]
MRIQPHPEKTEAPARAAEGSADDADTVAMRNDEPVDAPPPPAPDVAGADAETVAMKIVAKPEDDAKTTALPVQPRPDQQATQKIRTDAVPPRPAPMTKPPMTPRPAAGPKQPGKQGPSQQQPQPRRVPHAQSPADVQMTLPVQSVFQPAGQQPPQQRPHQPQPMAAPQRVEPAAPAAASGKSKRLLIGAGAAAALVIALVAGGVAFANRSDDSPQTQVREAIGDYTSALKAGDLAALRSSTCGSLHDFYAKLPEADFAGVHKLSQEQKTIPVVDEVDAIQISDGKALAQATVYTAADPSKKSARTFDLERTADGWKVCDPPPSS